VSPPREYLWKTRNYWSLQCLTAPPIANVAELSMVKLSTLAIQIIMSVTPGLRGNWIESRQISTRCTEVIADYFPEIKIAIFQSVSECQGDEWRSSSYCGRFAAKIARFNSVNSDIIGRKFTRLVHDVAGLLPFNFLKAAWRSVHPLSNARAKSKCRSWRCLRNSPKFNWLPKLVFLFCDFLSAVHTCLCYVTW